MKVGTSATRSGDWWAVEATVPGVFTQVKRLDQVPAMVADAVSLLCDVPASEVEVDVRVILDDQLDADLRDMHDLWSEVQELQHKASVRTRAVVAELRAQGLSVRDVGQIVGLSPQRVSQLGLSDPA